ncbi:glutamate decarboxylase 2-like [Cryptomeria japonica]|uniref:glutamate decarboxylase 2-like n=1 Tax=Cryptomeria japonica TaxID=3369 RepID=UPI0027DA58FF|nr:glutamate decarboxylase 2-like [Cryptomeria japonica]
MGVPVVAFSFSLKDNTEHDEYEISDHLRKYGWIVPAYTMDPDAQHITLLRVVVREDFNRTLAEHLAADVDRVSKELEELPPKIIHAVQGLAISEEGKKGQQAKEAITESNGGDSHSHSFAVLLLVGEEEEATAVGRTLTENLERTEKFKILSKDMGVPVVAFSFSLKDNTEHDEYEISDHLRKYGWIVPAYTMAPDAQHITLLCVVVREDFNL